MRSLSRLGAIIKKEVLQLSRDRLTFGMVFGLPIIQILLFGFAINTDVRNLKSAIANQSQSNLSWQFVSELGASQVVDIQQAATSATALEEQLRRGEISIGILIPSDFDRRVADRDRAAVHLLVDGSDPTILSVANQLRSMSVRFDTASNHSRPDELIEVRPYFNPERRTPVYIVPGLIGIILMMTMMLFTAVAIVRERERGNLELLINTPLSSAELMIGKVVPYIVIGLFQLAIILGFGRLLFDVPVRGSIFDLYVAGSAFIAANLALGLLISTATQTQFQAMQMTVFILMPSILLSGFMFPFDGMPVAAQIIGEALPTTHFIRLTRGIMLRDASLGEIAGDLYFLLIFSALALAIAAARFSKRLD